MCLAIPGQIKEINGLQTTIAYPGETRKALLGDDIKVKLGDFVMVQMGVVVKKLSAKEAGLSLKAWTKQEIDR
jgi:hydrogenase assembly chaperone HypC/HupF